MSSGPPLVELKGIHKRFPGVYALQGVDLDLRPGEVHALVGENGAGKSTLIRVLTGACGFEQGQYLVSGSPANVSEPRDAIRLGISAVYQEVELVPALSVAENLFLGRLPSRRGMVRRAELRRAAASTLEQVGLGIDPDVPAGQLGLAVRQLIEIGRALTVEARVLVLDEPTSALTPAEATRLLGLIARLRERGVAILYVSHKLDEVLSLADRVTVLRDGQRVTTEPADQLDQDRLIRLMVGRTLQEVSAGYRVSPRAVVLRVDGLSTARVHDVSLCVRRGEIVGLAGLMGAGRTEVARAVLGLDRRRHGVVLIDGQPVPPDSCDAARRLGMGLVPEDRRADGIFPELGMAENASIASLARFQRWGWLLRRRELAAVGALAQRLTIRASWLGQRLAELSGGNQQKVVLARWLLRQGLKVLFVDEPTRGIDVGARAEIHRLLGELAAQGLALVVISSELPEILALCDRVYVVKAGGIVGQVDRASATEEGLLALAV